MSATFSVLQESDNRGNLGWWRIIEEIKYFSSISFQCIRLLLRYLVTLVDRNRSTNFHCSKASWKLKYGIMSAALLPTSKPYNVKLQFRVIQGYTYSHLSRVVKIAMKWGCWLNRLFCFCSNRSPVQKHVPHKSTLFQKTTTTPENG